jgi:hypothetical protein
MGPGIDDQDILHRGDKSGVGLGRNDPVFVQARMSLQMA